VQQKKINHQEPGKIPEAKRQLSWFQKKYKTVHTSTRLHGSTFLLSSGCYWA